MAGPERIKQTTINQSEVDKAWDSLMDCRGHNGELILCVHRDKKLGAYGRMTQVRVKFV